MNKQVIVANFKVTQVRQNLHGSYSFKVFIDGQLQHLDTTFNSVGLALKARNHIWRYLYLRQSYQSQLNKKAV